jgi:hypothetical protein
MSVSLQVLARNRPSKAQSGPLKLGIVSSWRKPGFTISVDHNLRLKADHNPRLGRWIVIQREPL